MKIQMNEATNASNEISFLIALQSNKVLVLKVLKIVKINLLTED